MKHKEEFQGRTRKQQADNEEASTWIWATILLIIAVGLLISLVNYLLPLFGL